MTRCKFDERPLNPGFRSCSCSADIAISVHRPARLPDVSSLPPPDRPRCLFNPTSICGANPLSAAAANSIQFAHLHHVSHKNTRSFISLGAREETRGSFPPRFHTADQTPYEKLLAHANYSTKRSQLLNVSPIPSHVRWRILFLGVAVDQHKRFAIAVSCKARGRAG